MGSTFGYSHSSARLAAFAALAVLLIAGGEQAAARLQSTPLPGAPQFSYELGGTSIADAQVWDIAVEQNYAFAVGRFNAVRSGQVKAPCEGLARISLVSLRVTHCARIGRRFSAEQAMTVDVKHGRVYVGGEFSEVSVGRGVANGLHNLAAFSTRDLGLLGWRPVVGDGARTSAGRVNDLRVIARAGRDLVYVTGDFQRIGRRSLTENAGGLARFDAQLGVPVPLPFELTASQPGDRTGVGYSLTDADARYLYVGGEFSTLQRSGDTQPADRRHAAAVDLWAAGGGAVTGWSPDSDEAVEAIAWVPNHNRTVYPVIIGGRFSGVRIGQVGERFSPLIAATDSRTGLSFDWYPTGALPTYPNQTGKTTLLQSGVIRTITRTKHDLVYGGAFWLGRSGSTLSTNLAAADAQTGLPTWTPSPNGMVLASATATGVTRGVAGREDLLLVGGSFTQTATGAASGFAIYRDL